MAPLPPKNHPLTGDADPGRSAPSARAETGLYLHIPFCDVKCRFCDFAAYPGRKNDIPRYRAALERDLRDRAREFPDRRLATFYVGGGTPTVYSAAELTALANLVTTLFPAAPDWEATLEANPEGAALEKMAAARAAGFNRLSLGLQSSDDRLLKTLGRLHTFDGFKTAFRTARAAGFDNVNVDLMFGLPGQTADGWRDTLDRVLALAPDHLSAYALTVEDATYFKKSGVASDPDFQAELYEIAADRLAAAGFVHYEISNFARPGKESRHNLRYWRNVECLGAGVSAAWYVGGRRRKNHESLTDYLSAIESGAGPVADVVELGAAERRGEDLMLGLRLREGVRPSPEALADYGPVLERFAALGFLTRSGEAYLPTRRGWILSNQLFEHLLSPVGSPP